MYKILFRITTLKSSLNDVSTSTVTVPSGYTANENSLRKNLKTVTLNYRINNYVLAKRTSYNVGTVPNGYTPSKSIMTYCLIFESNGFPYTIGYVTISTTGAITILGNATIDGKGFVIYACYVL